MLTVGWLDNLMFDPAETWVGSRARDHSLGRLTSGIFSAVGPCSVTKCRV